MATLVTDKGAPYIEDIWNLEDFRNVADGYEEDFSEEDLLEAMEIVVHNFDANYGITWDTIEFALESILYLQEQRERDDQ